VKVARVREEGLGLGNGDLVREPTAEMLDTTILPPPDRLADGYRVRKRLFSFGEDPKPVLEIVRVCLLRQV
jgi:hypothetical protein